MIVRRINSMVYLRHRRNVWSIFLLLRNVLLSKALEKRTFTFTEVEHHVRDTIPFSVRLVCVSSVPFLFWSKPKKRPMTVREPFRTFCYNFGITNTHFFDSFLSPHNVVLHWHEDNSSWECSSHWCSVIMFLDLGENLQCCESWENFHLKLHRPSVDSIQFSTLGWIRKPIDFLLRCAYGIFTDSAHAQHWIGELRRPSLLTTELLGQLSFVSASDIHTWELDAASFWFASPFAIDSNLLDGASRTPGDLMRKLGAVEELAAIDQVQRRLRLCHEFPFSCSMLSSFRHHFGQLAELKMLILNRWRRFIPLIACESVPCQYVCELFFGVNIIWFGFFSPSWFCLTTNQAQLCGFGYVSHCWTSVLDDHLDHLFIIFKNEEHRTRLRRLLVWGNTANIAQIKIVVLVWNVGFVLGVLGSYGVTRRVSSYLTFGVVDFVWWRMKHFFYQIPDIKSWHSIHA